MPFNNITTQKNKRQIKKHLLKKSFVNKDLVHKHYYTKINISFSTQEVSTPLNNYFDVFGQFSRYEIDHPVRIRNISSVYL